MTMTRRTRRHTVTVVVFASAAILSLASRAVSFHVECPACKPVQSAQYPRFYSFLEGRGPNPGQGRNHGGSSRPCSGGTARSASPSATIVDDETGLVSRGVHQPEYSIAEITFVIEDPQAPSKFGRKSPVKATPTTVDEAVRHLCDKVFWFADGRITTRIVSLMDRDVDTSRLASTGVLIALGVRNQTYVLDAVWKARAARAASETSQLCHFAIDCSIPLPALVGPLNLDGSDAVASVVSRLLPWTKQATARRLHSQMSQLFDRWTTDDFCSALLLFVNQFVAEVDWVKHSIDATWEKGPARNAAELASMVSKCGDCIGRCLADDNCRECITKLTQVDSRDQVASYQTIVSYESELLRDFSLCILTKNNIFGCDATIPSLPVVAPIRSWRGQPLTEDAARSLLVGHLSDPTAPAGGLGLDVSWKVACGANVAYDQFPSQNQLFYPAARGRDMWYDPVFRVQTLDGRSVWCKRHYKVRPAPQPGTFRLSVLDNGVTSNEFWTIVGAAEDLSWVVFHYAGAASAVGQRYLGGLLCTPDGNLPPENQLPEIWKLFQSAGIQPWELYQVDNDDFSPGALEAGPPPLNFYRDEVRARQAASQQS